ncbi:skin secretory protein xP2 (protein APEG), partial [Lactococcus lactis]
TFLLLVLNWDGISLGLDPMIVLCTLGALWLLEIALLSVTLYKFNTLRAILARPTLSIR